MCQYVILNLSMFAIGSSPDMTRKNIPLTNGWTNLGLFATYQLQWTGWPSRSFGKSMQFFWGVAATPPKVDGVCNSVFSMIPRRKSYYSSSQRFDLEKLVLLVTAVSWSSCSGIGVAGNAALTAVRLARDQVSKSWWVCLK